MTYFVIYTHPKNVGLLGFHSHQNEALEFAEQFSLFCQFVDVIEASTYDSSLSTSIPTIACFYFLLSIGFQTDFPNRSWFFIVISLKVTINCLGPSDHSIQNRCDSCIALVVMMLQIAVRNCTKMLMYPFCRNVAMGSSADNLVE